MSTAINHNHYWSFLVAVSIRERRVDTIFGIWDISLFQVEGSVLLHFKLVLLYSFILSISSPYGEERKLSSGLLDMFLGWGHAVWYIIEKEVTMKYGLRYCCQKMHMYLLYWWMCQLEYGECLWQSMQFWTVVVLPIQNRHWMGFDLTRSLKMGNVHLIYGVIYFRVYVIKVSRLCSVSHFHELTCTFLATWIISIRIINALLRKIWLEVTVLS